MSEVRNLCVYVVEVTTEYGGTQRARGVRFRSEEACSPNTNPDVWVLWDMDGSMDGPDERAQLAPASAVRVVVGVDHG
ncbi:MAG: hypothetical protein AAF211_22310 [Myxococcota bacterium]